MNKQNMTILKVTFIIVIASIIMFTFCNMGSLRHCTPQNIKSFVESYGIFSPIIYIILFTFIPLTLFPDSILAIAGGMCFGMVGGFIYTMIGAILGGTLSFFLARIMSHKVLNKLVKKNLSNLESAIKKRGFLLVLVLRLIPLFPFDIISYAAGFSGIKFKDFALATVLGIIPGIFVFINIGDKSTEIGSSSFYVSLSLLIGLFVVAYFLKKKISLKAIQN
jgi:uncharacterized membrane protein YdjX (TVP38/TMEM64 family)